MRRPSAAQLERARLLLAHEEALGSRLHEPSDAAGRVYDKLGTHLAPLLGSTGVEALFARSAQLTKSELASPPGAVSVDGSTRIRESLRAQEPAVAKELAAAFFGTFLELLTTFIGERLTAEALRRAWPAIPRENGR